MRARVGRFAVEQSGGTAIEYGLIGALIVAIAVVGGTTLGTRLSGAFNAVVSSVMPRIADANWTHLAPGEEVICVRGSARSPRGTDESCRTAD